MTTIKTFFADLHRDEDGAAFLEYTVLLGIILAVSISVIFAVGAYAGNIWQVLCSALPAIESADGTVLANAITGCETTLSTPDAS